MDMNAMNDIREALCRELEEIAQRQQRERKLSAGELEVLHKLTDTIKNTYKIELLSEGEYSHDGGASYNDGYSYRRSRGGNRRGTHYVRGHYSRDGGYSGDRFAGNRYSRDDGREHMADQLQDVIDNIDNDRDRETLQRCLDMLRS